MIESRYNTINMDYPAFNMQKYYYSFETIDKYLSNAIFISGEGNI